MKTYLLSLIAISSFAISSAQSQNSITAGDSKEPYLSINESVLPHSGSSKSEATNLVTSKTLKQFKKDFKNVSGETWEQSTTGFVAVFHNDAVQSNIYYDKKGNLEATMKCYFENGLDKDVRATVKQKYYDDKITYIQEIKTIENGDMPTYIVHLEGEDDFKLVKVQDGEMTVIEQYNKQK